MTNLRNLVDTSDEVLRGLKALGTEATNRDPWLIQILMQKLDTETKRLWSVKTTEKDFLTLKEFLEFLNVRCSSLELMTCNDSDTKVSIKSNFIAGSVGQQEISNIELDAVNTTLNSSTSVNNAKCVSFLPTAKALLYNNEGGSFLFRALLDSGSESSFISENAINILGLKRCNDRLSLSGIQAGTTRGSVGLKIGSRFCKDRLTIKSYILNKDTSQIPVEKVKIKDYLEGIPLADEDFSKPTECDVILGSDCFFSILRNGRIIGSKGQTIAPSTIFGWVVAEEEEFCENHFKTTYKINNEGRFAVKLPIYRDINQLGNRRGLAVSRLLAMGNKFKSDVELEQEYKNFMEEYEKMGHMSPNKELDFLPHHAVRRKDSITTKLMVVFDGSCKPPNSNSLNSVLGVGQILQPDIFILLVRFRVKEICFYG
ncbi:DUF1758 domain-containing protein [Trichonephila clavipes]|nr:DUF1758 domain-containing protein [Trichonephila clavipes]